LIDERAPAPIVLPVRTAYKHLIWDWNGTLLADVDLVVDIMNGMLAARGLQTITREGYRHLFEFPVINYYRRLGFDLLRDPFEKVSAEFVAAYQARHLECSLHNGAGDTLDRLARLGPRQSLLSATKHDQLEKIVTTRGLSGRFTHTLGVSDIYASGKLDQGRELLRRLALDPGEVLLVGDTLHDAEVAEALGAPCVLIAHGHNHPGRLRATGWPVFEDLAAFAEPLAAGERFAPRPAQARR